MGGAGTQRRDLPRTLVVAMMVMTVLIVIDTTNKKCGANSVTDTILSKSNGTNNIIAYEDLEMEFQMDSEISRRILQQKKFVTPGTANGNRANCGAGRDQRYDSCLGPPSGGKPICKSSYDRSCKRGS